MIFISTKQRCYAKRNICFSIYFQRRFIELFTTTRWTKFRDKTSKITREKCEHNCVSCYSLKVPVYSVALETKLKQITFYVFVVECTIAIKYDVFIIAFCTQMFKPPFLFNILCTVDLFTRNYERQKIIFAFYFSLHPYLQISNSVLLGNKENMHTIITYFLRWWCNNYKLK